MKMIQIQIGSSLWIEGENTQNNLLPISSEFPNFLNYIITLEVPKRHLRNLKQPNCKQIEKRTEFMHLIKRPLNEQLFLHSHL